MSIDTVINQLEKTLIKLPYSKLHFQFNPLTDNSVTRRLN